MAKKGRHIDDMHAAGKIKSVETHLFQLRNRLAEWRFLIGGSRHACWLDARCGHGSWSVGNLLSMFVLRRVVCEFTVKLGFLVRLVVLDVCFDCGLV